MNLNDKLIFLKGNNFSGKTSYFLNKIKSNNEIEQSETTLLIKELPVNNITGIFSSVIEELNLHCTNTEKELKSKVFEFLNQISFNEHLDKNPFSLSGGEQTILVLICNILLQPNLLMIDSTIEQLNETWYKPFFEFVEQNKNILNKIIIADNRYLEYGINNYQEVKPQKENLTYEYKFKAPQLLNDNSICSINNKISIKDLSFNYPKGKAVFSNINFEFENGNIYHLNGKNGAGKSTLAKILTGVLKVPKGKLQVNGFAYNGYNSPGSLCGYSFQNPDEQIFTNKVEKEVLPYLKNEPMDYSKRRELYLKMFGLEDIRGLQPAELPFVVRKRIALASTFAMNRDWYIIDEPTLGQDENFVIFFAELMNSLSKKGKGIILISHCKSLLQKLDLKELNLNNNL